jgi:hypothetical protein
MSNRTATILPMGLSEGRFTGTLKLTKGGHVFDFFGGDGRVRRMTAIPFSAKSRKPYVRKNGRVTTIRPAS